MHVDYALIGSRIKAARKNKNLTQEALAEKLDVSIGYVSQIERGTTKISLDLLGSLSGILERDLSFFVSEASLSSSDYRKSEFLSDFEKLSPRDKRLLGELAKNMLHTKEQ